MSSPLSRNSKEALMGDTEAAVRDRRYEEIRGTLNASAHFDRTARIYALVATCKRAEEALQAERDRLREALEAIRDHGKTHDQPCWGISNGDCADVMQGIARAALDA